MRIVLIGPGRAGTALCLATRRAGHDIVAVGGRNLRRSERAARQLGADAFVIGDPVPPCDLVVIAVPDTAIADVAEQVASQLPDGAAVVHLSGATPVSELRIVAERNPAVGSFHPLQTLPTPVTGARTLAGAWIAITAAEPLRSELGRLARSIAAIPFDLDDEAKALYHAAAVAAANFPVASLAVAEALFAEAGVPFHASRPLTEAAVANAFELGPDAALTGPIARRDRRTVERQHSAVAERAAAWVSGAFAHLVAATEVVADSTEGRD